jgi:hypothetical protein
MPKGLLRLVVKPPTQPDEDLPTWLSRSQNISPALADMLHDAGWRPGLVMDRDDWKAAGLTPGDIAEVRTAENARRARARAT